MPIEDPNPGDERAIERIASLYVLRATAQSTDQRLDRPLATISEREQHDRGVRTGASRTGGDSGGGGGGGERSLEGIWGDDQLHPRSVPPLADRSHPPPCG